MCLDRGNHLVSWSYIVFNSGSFFILKEYHVLPIMQDLSTKLQHIISEVPKLIMLLDRSLLD